MHMFLTWVQILKPDSSGDIGIESKSVLRFSVLIKAEDLKERTTMRSITLRDRT